MFQIDPLIRLFFLIEACWQLQPPTCGHQWSLTNNLWLQVPTAQSSFHQTGFVLFELSSTSDPLKDILFASSALEAQWLD